MDTLEVPGYPPPPPPKRPSKPKITLQIPSPVPPTPRVPTTPSAIYWGPTATKYYGKAPQTPASLRSDPHTNPYFNPFMHMYQNKASDFMFKQFEGFKDFTMNTAKSGLSMGEKTAFWFYNKLKLLSKKWFTHFFLTICLVLYSVMGAAMFMALEAYKEPPICSGRRARKVYSIREYLVSGAIWLMFIVFRTIPILCYLLMGVAFIICQSPNEEHYDKNLTDIRREVATRIHIAMKNQISLENSPDILQLIEQDLATYEESFMEYQKHVNNHDTENNTWTFWNAMFYAGTIYTTIGRMSDEETDSDFVVSVNVPERIESETQTLPPIRNKRDNMEDGSYQQSMSMRKRRNLSKNRQNPRHREKTPEPGRANIPHEDTTSDDEENQTQRTSREIEADNTYEEMKRLVQEQAKAKDPVYDLDTDEILEARAQEATERRRRSISPFALPGKEDMYNLKRKGSFMDPDNKMLSTTYSISSKDDGPNRRNSLTLEPQDKLESRNSLSPPVSPTRKDFPQNLPAPAKKLEEMVYPDEISKEVNDKPKTIKTVKKEEPTIIEKEVKKVNKSEPLPVPGELVTKVIQVERTPSKKLSQDQKPVVEVRERVVRTPSKKSDTKPVVVKQGVPKSATETQTKVPPVKPARSKSSSRFVSKTSESEMSEDQINQQDANSGETRRKVVPIPRRFIKNRSPRENRSHSVQRIEDTRGLDKTGTGMSETSREIIELLQKARARSLSIPKEDPRLPTEYKQHSRTLKTPNKTPVNLRQTRGISCPKTIQIISDKEILSGLTKSKVNLDHEKHSRHSSGYVDASQSEYTSSSYSSSPSENEYEFDLLERSAELTRKLNQLRKRESRNESDIFSTEELDQKAESEPKSVLRKRSIADKPLSKRVDKEIPVKKPEKSKDIKTKKIARSPWKLLENWQEFKQEYKIEYDKITYLRNRCICDLFLIIIMCGLGGMMFKALEGSFENAYKCSTRNVKRDFIESLWRGSHYLREEDWKSMARKKLYEFEDQLHTAHEAGVTSYSGQRSWNFMNSFVYCMTLVTTIGYGHIAPKTTYGRVATIAYAIIGIPLFLIVLADFGKLFTRIIKFFWAFIRRFYYTRSCRRVRRTAHMQDVMKGLNTFYDVVRRPSQIFTEEDIKGAPMPDGDKPPPLERKSSDVPPPLPPKPGTLTRDFENETEPETPAPSVFEIDDEFNLPISVAIFILVVYIIIGAVGYNIWENWDFFESFYFVFISMSTIGLGDMVPDHPMFMMASILYLVFGLALTSMCINVVQVKLSDTFKQASAKLGATIGLKVAEEDGSLVPMTPPPIEVPAVHKPKAEENKSKETIDDDSQTR